jgi:hypothetical protein
MAFQSNDKDGADWTDTQTITNVRNAFGGSLLDLYDSLKSLCVDITNWNQIKERIKIGFEAAPSASSVVYKITEIKQADHEDVYEYFGRCISTVIEFQSIIDPKRYV